MANFGTNNENFITMLQQKKQTKNMHLHIDEVYRFLDAHLPYYYVEEVIEIFQRKGFNRLPSKSTIRKVRSRNAASYEKRLDILNALVDLAKKNKSNKEKINKKVTALTT
ncbi:MAG TPA: hypothetical protein DDZ41_09640 [Flavobacterium sp.]|nr:hypothetical protein [Flavobacterium sp.]